jgi:Mg-chelatase subunit ChlD
MDGQIVIRWTGQKEEFPGEVQLRIDGADNVVSEGGWLSVNTAAGETRWPVSWLQTSSDTATVQAVDAGTFEVSLPFPSVLALPVQSRIDYSSTENTNGFIYSTVFGGSSWDSAAAITASTNGLAYVAGTSQSTNFPTTPGAFDPSINGNADAFVVGLNASGASMRYVTFLGGSDYDDPSAIHVDKRGAAYLTGTTWSPDFPTTTGAWDRIFNGNSQSPDAFVAILGPDGNTLIGSTYLGGSSVDVASDMALDDWGLIYVTGYTGPGFPVTSTAYDASFNGSDDVYLAILNDALTQLFYSTYLGGRYLDEAYAIALDDGDMVLSGTTMSSDFPTTDSAYDRSFNGALGDRDVFVAKIGFGGHYLQYSTFVGGSGGEEARSVAVDATGNTYIAGYTRSGNFPVTASSLDSTPNGGLDAFAASLDRTGSRLRYSTYLGGSGDDAGACVSVDATGGSYIAGSTDSPDFPTQAGSFDVTHNGLTDGYLVKIDATGQTLLYGTFLGGSSSDSARTNWIDNIGNVYLAGSTSSDDFPVEGAPSTARQDSDVFVTKLFVGNALPSPTPTLASATPTPSATPLSAPTRVLATPTATPNFPECVLTVDKTAYPSVARKDGQIGVTLRLSGSCASEIGAAVDAALVIDRSASMCGEKLNQAQAAGQVFLDSMAFPPDQASVISFASTAQLHSGLTGNRQQATNALYGMACGGLSRIDAGLNKAREEMTGPRRVAGHTPAIILLTDGNPEGAYAADVRAAAQQIRNAGILLYTVGLGQDVNAALLREIASQPDHYFQSPTPADLAQIYSRLAGDVRESPAANLLITDVVAPEFEIVPGSFTGAAQPQMTGNTLRWYLPRLTQGQTEVSFSVRPKQCGAFDVNRSAVVDYEDNRGARRSAVFPVPRVTVEGCGSQTTDVFIRDNGSDTGIIPSAQPWWVSPDIWVRHANDGGTQHQNPRAGQRNTIYARVWNRGSTTVTDIDVSFYFANPALGLTWPTAWQAIPPPQRIASLAPGQSAIVSVAWDAPNLAGHWCLLVRINAAADPIRDDRVRWENNIAQRNLHMIEYSQPAAGKCELDDNGLQTDRIAFEVVNTLATASAVDLRIELSGLAAGAEVRFEPGPLTGRWASLDGLSVEPDGRLKVISLPAIMYGVQLNPAERRAVYVEVRAPGNNRFTVGLAQMVRGNVVGGNSYERWLPPCPVRLPIIMKPGPAATPTATPCPPGQYTPPDVMLALDRSGSMAGGKLDAAKQAVSIFLDQMDLNVEQAGIASFNDAATLNQALTHNRGGLNTALNGLIADGRTAIGEGIAIAEVELQSSRHEAGHTRAIVLLSDGQNNAGRDPMTVANAAKAAGTVIFTIGLGSDADANLLRQLASDASFYYFAPTPDRLAEIYRTIAGEIRCR